jgi:4-hydroxy-tetrahydrodipicolinate reductase
VAIRTIHYGIGSIGAAIVREIAGDRRFEVVGAIDAAPDKASASLGKVVGDERLAVVTILPPEARTWPPADVVLHTTGSFLPGVLPQLKDCIGRGLHVVSSCEELAFPYPRFGDIATQLDSQAKARGVSLLATGVNPGFVMDTLPIALSAVCADVRSVRITRVLDASNRRLPFQRKIGAGLTRQEFAAKAEGGGFGHVGLRESAMAVASAFGWEPYEIEDTLQAITAERDVASPNLSVRRGEIAGLHQRLLVSHKAEVKITMELVMAMGAADPRDEVEIDGDPPIRSVIPGGVQGDRATVGIMINAARVIAAAPRGLITMRDIPPLHWQSGVR